MARRTRLSGSTGKPRSTRLATSKYSCGTGFGRAYDSKGRIVAYVGTLTWPADEKPEIAPDMKTYVISYWVEPAVSSPKQRFDVEPYLEEVVVHAVDLEAMKTALGWYSKYESEWGDYAGVVERLKRGLADVFTRDTKMTQVDFRA